MYFELPCSDLHHLSFIQQHPTATLKFFLLSETLDFLNFLLSLVKDSRG